MFEEFKGALTVQFAAQQLVAGRKELYYFTKENSSGELDFIVQQGNYIIPVEVKAEENLQAKVCGPIVINTDQRLQYVAPCQIIESRIG